MRQTWHRGVVRLLATVAACAAMTGCAGNSGLNGASGGWGTAFIAPGTFTLNGYLDTSTPHGGFDSFICPVAGECVAAGTYISAAGVPGVFTLSQADGKWRSAAPLPGVRTLDAGQTSLGGSAATGAPPTIYLSCSAPAECAAVGDYVDEANTNLAFAASDRRGSWSRTRELSVTTAALPQALVLAAACSPAPGGCTAGGVLFTGNAPFPDQIGAAFIADEHGGTWGAGHMLTGSVLRHASIAKVTSISCPDASGCTAAGYAVVHGIASAFVVSEHDGTWGPADPVPGLQGLFGGSAVLVSCGAAGDCQAAAVSGKLVMTAAEHDGRWGRAMSLPGFAVLDAAALSDGQYPTLTSLSCGPRDCAAGGSYVDSGLRSQAWVASYSDGTWRTVRAEPRRGHLNYGWTGGRTLSVSCARSGSCIAGGYYTRHVGTGSGSQATAFLVISQGGRWRPAQRVPGLAALGRGKSSVQEVSCPPSGPCVAAGSVMRNGVTRLFLISQ